MGRHQLNYHANFNKVKSKMELIAADSQAKQTQHDVTSHQVALHEF